MVLPVRNKRRALLLGAVGLGLLLFGCVPDAPDGDLPSGPELTFSVMLAWDEVTKDAEGNDLDDLATYRIYYSRETPVTPASEGRADVGLETVATVSDLDAGTWYFAVAAVDSVGNESDLSGEISAEVGPQ